MKNDDPVKMLSGRQLEVFALFNEESLSVIEIKEKLNISK
jgi:predicted DNA-binding protein YlxM (UPF0122 family)